MHNVIYYQSQFSLSYAVDNILTVFQALCQDTLKYIISLLTPSHTGNEDLKEAYLAQGNTVFQDVDLGFKLGFVLFLGLCYYLG